MSHPRRPAFSLAQAAAIAAFAAGLSACQDQRNDFNPVNILCPGDFDPVANRCVIQTGDTPATK